MAEYCPSCGETLTAKSATCTFCGQVLPEVKLVAAAEPASLASVFPPPPTIQKNELMAPPPPVVIIEQQSPAAARASTRNPQTAFFLEFLGVIGFLGIGHMYSGRVALGIVLLLIGIVFFGTVIPVTFGTAYICLFVPALLASYFSGQKARNYLLQQQKS